MRLIDKSSIPIRVPVFISLLVILSGSIPTFGETFSLDGFWQFTNDSSDTGISNTWFDPGHERSSWRTVRVPHTWQVEPGMEDYAGIAWYARTFQTDLTWKNKEIILEFGAIYRDATIWLNGKQLMEHNGSGWTPFTIPLTGSLNPKGVNTLVVRVDNRFSKNALPYLDSFDWPTDGGITRRVQLHIMPKTHITRVLIDAKPQNDFSNASIAVTMHIATPKSKGKNVYAEAAVFDPAGRLVAQLSTPIESLNDGTLGARLKGNIQKPMLWHFDSPQLYRLRCRLMDRKTILHQQEAEFGIRSVEVKDGFYFLNGEPMRLMGVEWMPGSDPRYGMAEDPRVAREILTDMKRLNCVLTRFHWQQDDPVFEFCDREGMLVQEEIPAWGGKTMQGKLNEIQELHTREMILPHYNHPSIYAWGLCNEIGGQSKEAHAFIRNGIELARALDPNRLLTYASNSLQKTPERDASALVDFIEWNDYWESWYGGTVANLETNLELIAKAYPKKSVVVSEYGLCECNPKNPSGDRRRIEILKTHTDCYRKSPNVAGAIFFNYNDYRTHIGDKGQGSFKQRVHGVVDILNRPKPSWEALRRESSPIKTLTVTAPKDKDKVTRSTVTILTRALENDLPAYTLRNYLLVWTAYNALGQPLGTGKKALPDLPPGSNHPIEIDWPTFPSLERIEVEIFRPTGYSVLDTEWRVR